MKSKEVLEITNIGGGVENSLIAVVNKNGDSSVYISIQNNNHITNNPEIALVADATDFSKFLTKIRKELIGHHTPELKQVALLSCKDFCEVLRVIKVNNNTFDVKMYYNYKRPRNKVCQDCVSLTAVDLEKFIGGIIKN